MFRLAIRYTHTHTCKHTHTHMRRNACIRCRCPQRCRCLHWHWLQWSPFCHCLAEPALTCMHLCCTGCNGDAVWRALPGWLGPACTNQPRALQVCCSGPGWGKIGTAGWAALPRCRPQPKLSGGAAVHGRLGGWTNYDLSVSACLPAASCMLIRTSKRMGF